MRYCLLNAKTYEEYLRQINSFLPYVDNWAVCDTLISRSALLKVFAGHFDALSAEAAVWTQSEKVYTIRYGIGILMNFFLEQETFTPSVLELAAKVRQNDYYVKIMQAWFFATALCKQYEAAVSFLEQHRLEPWTHNKAIQKAVESRRIPEERKKYLKTLRITRRKLTDPNA